VKGWIATVTLIALAVPGGLAVGSAQAAEAIPRAVHARHHGSHHHILVTRVVDRRPVFGYLGRPVYYIPAPFPLGFDFGFGW